MIAAGDIGLSVEKTAVFPEERDKLVFQQMYYLKTLYELTAELSPITSSQKLLESFLLMIMGVNGSAQAMLMICDRRNQQVMSANRGARFDMDWTVESAEKYLYRGFQTAENRRLAPMSVTFIGDPHQVFPELETGLDVDIALLFMMDDSLLGVVGLGAAIDGREYKLEEKDILSGLTANFMVFLKNVRAYETVQALNDDLFRTNDALRQTIVDLTDARQQIRLLEVAGIRLKELFHQKIERVGRFRALMCCCFLWFQRCSRCCSIFPIPTALRFCRKTLSGSRRPRWMPGLSGNCLTGGTSFWWMPDLLNFSIWAIFRMLSISRPRFLISSIP